MSDDWKELGPLAKAVVDRVKAKLDGRDNVVTLPVVTSLNLQPDRVLGDLTGKLKSVVVVGWDTEGGEVFASSLADGAEVLWLLERAKLKLLRVVDK